MTKLNTKCALEFTSHRSDKVKIVDDQIVLIHRQLLDIVPNSKRVQLLQHAIVMQSATRLIKQTQSLALVFYGQIYRQVGVVAAEHYIYGAKFLKYRQNLRSPANMPVPCRLDGVKNLHGMN